MSGWRKLSKVPSHRIFHQVILHTDRATITLLSYNDPVILDSPPIDAELDQVSFNTDIAYFDAKDKVKGKYLFGGGSIKNAHSKNEFIPKDELHKCTAILVKLVNHLYQE